MLIFLFVCLFIIKVHSDAVNETTTTDPWTTTSPATFTPPGDYSSIYCDYFPEPTEVDEGNYGDGFCATDDNSDVGLLLRKTIITSDGQTFSSGSYSFPRTIVTRVQLLNFGRSHGATNAIGIFNEQGTGGVEYYIDIFSGKGIRMFLEIYGFTF